MQDNLQKRYNVLFEMYTEHIHEHRLGAGKVCEGCVELANAEIERRVMKESTMNAEITKTGVFDMQVCVPVEWTDEQVVRFANEQNPAGTETGWHIRTAESPYQAGAPTRVTCADDPKKVHIMLEC